MLETCGYQCRRMELRHLRYFVTVAEELNFRRAAERLNVTRPALSKQIKDLERELGVVLLERNTVRVQLTGAGDVYLNEARGILERVRQAGRMAKDAQAGRRGRMFIGSVGPIASGFLPGTLKTFGEQYPDVDVSFVEMTPMEQPEALARGRIDVGFAYGRAVEHYRHVKTQLLIESRFGVAIRRDHPFALRESVRLQELSHTPLLCLGTEDDSQHCRNMMAFFEEEGYEPEAVRYVQGFDSLLTLVAGDQGITMLPRVLDFTQSHGIAIVPLEAKADLSFNMWAVWRKDETSPLVSNFTGMLKRKTKSPSLAVFRNPAA
jgi:DNA-binding transcriptional LysR family regulator